MPKAVYRIFIISVEFCGTSNCATRLTQLQEYFRSQGIDLNMEEEIPEDPYIKQREALEGPRVLPPQKHDDKLRRFLEFDGKILRFRIQMNSKW